METKENEPAPDIYADVEPDPRTCRTCLYEVKAREGHMCVREAGMRHPVEGWERCDFWKEGDRAVPEGRA